MRNHLSNEDKNLLIGLKTNAKGQYSGVSAAQVGLDLGTELQILTSDQELQSEESIGPGGCAEDGKACPDGSTVGRVPPACEFALCPEDNLQIQITQKKNYRGMFIFIALIALAYYIITAK